MLAAHEFALLLGGLSGVRDRGLIESAIARPYCGYYPSIALKAAALMHSLTLNHGFVDGKKRTALITTSILLDRSGYTLRGMGAPRLDRDAEAMALAIADHRMDFDDVVQWFHERVLAKSKRKSARG